MKSYKIIVISLCLMLGVSSFSPSDLFQEPVTKKINATYMGRTSELEYKFEDKDGEEIIFHELDFDLDVTLSKDLIGAKFKVTYTEEISEEESEEEEASQSYVFRMITALEEID